MKFLCQVFFHFSFVVYLVPLKAAESGCSSKEIDKRRVKCFTDQNIAEIDGYGESEIVCRHKEKHQLALECVQEVFISCGQGSAYNVNFNALDYLCRHVHELDLECVKRVETEDSINNCTGTSGQAYYSTREYSDLTDKQKECLYLRVFIDCQASVFSNCGGMEAHVFSTVTRITRPQCFTPDLGIDRVSCIHPSLLQKHCYTREGIEEYSSLEFQHAHKICKSKEAYTRAYNCSQHVSVTCDKALAKEYVKTIIDVRKPMEHLCSHLDDLPYQCVKIVEDQNMTSKCSIRKGKELFQSLNISSLTPAEQVCISMNVTRACQIEFGICGNNTAQVLSRFIELMSPPHCSFSAAVAEGDQDIWRGGSRTTSTGTPSGSGGKGSKKKNSSKGGGKKTKDGNSGSTLVAMVSPMVFTGFAFILTCI